MARIPLAVFIDTGAFAALRNADDENHDKSKELMRRALKTEFGRIYTSDYAIDEALTTALVRTRRLALAVDIGKHIMESPRITKLWTTKGGFENAWQKFMTLKDKPLRFTECTTLAHMKKDIRQVLSFDTGFDGIVGRFY